MLCWTCVIKMLYFTSYMIAVLVMLPAITVNGFLNLYMNETEAKRVLGLSGNFYFIRDGEVKNNAILFNMRIPSAVKCIGFTWFRTSMTSPITYSITVESLNPNLLRKPAIRMQGAAQNTGYVPEKKSGFCVKMECKGTKDGTAQIRINITLNEYTKNKLIPLSMRRTKTCRKVLPLVTSSDASSNVADSGKKDASFSTSEKTKVFYIAVGVACSIIFIIALAVAAIHVHSMPSPSTNKDSTSGSDGSSGQSNGPLKPNTAMENTVHTSLLKQTPQVAVQQPNQQSTVNHPHINQINIQLPVHNPPPNHIPVQVDVNHPHQHNPMLQRTNYMLPRPFPVTTLANGDIPSATSRTHSISSSVTAPMHKASVSSAPVELYPHAGGLTSTQKGKYGNRDIKAELAPLDVDLDRITLGDLLYEGTFARIYEGVLTGPEEHLQQSVLVKTVSEIASSEQVNLMLIESSMLRDLTHKNLMPIMSVCLEDEKQPLVMFPFMNRGNLKLFLKKSRSPEGLSKRSITTADLVQMGIQIAKGMQYLARRKIVHKDLAARNCFLDDELNVKVTDCALSRDLFPGDYCCLCDNENRPVKWMAVESLEFNRYSVASDVWAYGVLLWELMTLAQQPYANIDAFEMLAFLKKGHRIAQPLNCPDELFTVIACCWALSEDERPSFGQLIGCLTEFNNALSNFV
ncbi:tyrosine-protein kinase RYK-like isoform X2 [Actinia tenebrosa]|uniref:receptor protein-tyrosine kinase n=1 Tax=Actinia tenebrosa TaxID=6105 RepID=A0A6P8ILP2_ACTTE|nr:tyrosine-protein kinase RYK-like isoform X2 [Actinia tenebrosa]